MDITSIFITGLFAGGLSCLAVQGGLLASSIAQQQSDTLKTEAIHGHAVPIFSFLLMRLVAYTILGALLGSLGSIVQLSLTARVVMQMVAAIFMIGTALNLLHVHPLFRFFILQPPKFLTRMIKNQSRSKDVFGPALLGAMTVFIPCGATQAMMAYAIAVGSPITGAITLFVFILGTSPLFFLLGYAAKKLSGSLSETFNRVAGIAIILIALFNFNAALALAGSPVTFENALTAINCTVSFCDTSDSIKNTSEPVREATIYFTDRGYTTSPKSITIKSGTTIRLNLVNKTGAGCIQGFTIPKLGVQKVVRIGTSETITFVAPETTGTLAFMCSMGMYRGSFTVI